TARVGAARQHSRVSPPPPRAGAAAAAGPQPVPESAQGNDAENRQPQEDDTEPFRIMLWGAPRSGKTTYLAALPISAMQYRRHHEGSWTISGMTQESNAFLAHGVDLLTRQRTFPAATLGVQDLAWSLQGPEEKGKLGFRTRRPNFVVEMQDAAGEAFAHGHSQQAQLVGQLARSHGLIYLFDPVGDAEVTTESFTYLQATLTQLTAKLRNQGSLVDGKLPHYVSVCIAKFDHPEVFRPAVEAGWVSQDIEGSRLPRVPLEQSEHFFQWVCDEFRGSNARLVGDILYAHFDPKRISYYAISAVGFRLNPQHVFDYRDYANVEFVDGESRIRASPEPINVLEPLIDLERRIHSGRRGARRLGRRR
ncbi:hypothetical protein, partial [Streptomyces sp. NPDC058572]|uniref:hypothetical protein n=1 Tax=Streptomyces sp. NPDC058572 TaxID=3346546 RepID=UPI00365DBE74